MIYEGIKGVIFDMGSTLIEFEQRPWSEIMAEGQKLGYDRLKARSNHLPDFDTYNERLEEIKQEYRNHAKETLNEWSITDAFKTLLKEYRQDRIREDARVLTEAFYSVVRREIVLIDGVIDTLTEFHKRGIKMGLISNTIFPPDEHDKDLEEFGIRRFLSFTIYSCAFGCRKPRPEIYHEGLRLIGLPSEQVVYVGDRYTEDVAGPQSVGMKGVLRFREGREYPDPMPEGFPVIYHFPELLGIIKQ